MKMLEVTKIIEGGVDLRTGEELPRCIVISNGHREQEVPIDPLTLRNLVLMYSDMMNATSVVDENPEIFEESTEAVPKPGNGSAPAPNPRPTIRVVKADEPEVEEPTPSSDLIEEDSFEAGEEYDDSGTGIGSL